MLVLKLVLKTSEWCAECVQEDTRTESTKHSRSLNGEGVTPNCHAWICWTECRLIDLLFSWFSKAKVTPNVTINAY